MLSKSKTTSGLVVLVPKSNSQQIVVHDHHQLLCISLLETLHYVNVVTMFYGVCTNFCELTFVSAMFEHNVTKDLTGTGPDGDTVVPLMCYLRLSQAKLVA